MHILRSAAISTTLAVLAPTLLAQITPGNLLVSRVGDGSAALSNAATARFLDEYTPAGVFVQTIALPTIASGGNRAVTDSGTATSNGFISQSVDGRYLLAAGYDAVVGTAGVTSSASASVNRVICRIGLDGVVDSSTALGDAYTGNNFRSVASVDGTSFWTAGTGTAPTPGARHVAALGASTSTQLSSTVTNLRCINIWNGQLYCSSSSGAFLGVSTVGTGLPTTTGQTITSITTGTGASAYDFWFADANTLYVADDRTNGNGGIQKWTWNGSAWVLAYTLAPNATTGCRGLSGHVQGGVATLFATTTSALAEVVSVVDAGSGSPFTTLVTAATNTAFRDVQFVRTPSNLVHSGVACANNNGTPTVGTAGGQPVTGNANFAVTAGNCGANQFAMFLLHGGPVSPIGFPVPGTPACVQIYFLPDLLLFTLADGAGAATTPIPLPNSASLGGLLLAAQVAAFDLSLVGFDIPVGTSDALQITVGN
ncbi:MAG: hypothetical protein JNK15_23080 [Planctomycetes bacterium]|nr:hypothetical protein [Planctomycetota bacterium]